MSWFLWLILVWLAVGLWGRHSRKKGARQLVTLIRHLYAGRHEYREANPARFPHLDLEFYDETARLLEREGFVRLGDMEDVTNNEAPGGAGAPLFIRGLTGDGGRIIAGLYHFRMMGWRAWMVHLLGGTKSAKVVDFETELSDGIFLTTTNATSARAISLPPQILSDHLPSGCTPLEVLEVHRQRLADYLAEHPEVEVRPITTTDQAMDMTHRIQDLKIEHRKSMGGIAAQEELVRAADQMIVGTGEARQLAREIEKLREPERGDRT
jgi:hypothetical protein